ncbi:MAG: glycosyltransferase family 39 protein [Sphingobacteriaceae bacterium]|nr:MAG: glycosyltransferase family 39 protein [Sphingobacteriaceae bacterium]
MPASTLQKTELSDKPIKWFLLCWTIFNAVQAYTLEVHADEAYYWMYSKFMDWGYFDHPPMVAVFIWLGDHIMHNELGLRLVTVLTSTTAIYLLWLILKKYAVDAWLFILVISGMLIIHMYGFTTTPDAPLFFFTVVFYYLYQKYIEDDSWLLATLLGIVVACLMYSKYHAILLIGLTLASNIKLLKRGTFWGIVVIALVLFIPHILWQFEHEFPSLKYHLHDRSATIYNPENTYTYIPGQLLMAGPVIGWFLFYSVFKIKVKDAFIRGLLVNCVGAFIFFLLSTFRGEAQPHWTLIAFAPLAMLALIRFNQVNAIPRWFYTVAIINIVLILFIRISLMFGFGIASRVGQLKTYYGYKKWAQHIKSKAGDNYMIMSDGFQDPSKYNYYTNSIRAYSYDSRNYRHTQYDIWPIEEQFQGKQVYFLQDFPQEETLDTITNTFSQVNWYAQWVNNIRTYQKIVIETDVKALKLSAGQKQTIELTITNPYPYVVNFSNVGAKHPVTLEACYFKDGVMKVVLPADNSFYNLILKPGENKKFNFNVTAPYIENGNYELLFSIRTTPFTGGKNSRMIPITIN